MTPPFFDDDGDRSAILARRAAFVASALASLVATRVARADDDVPCPAPVIDAEARLASRAAEDALREGRRREPPMPIDEQITLAERMYLGAPTVENALLAMDLHVASGDPDRARRLGEAFQICRTPSPDVAGRLAALSARFVRVVVVPPAGEASFPGAALTFGARTVPFARGLEGVLVDPSITAVDVAMENGNVARVVYQPIAGTIVRVPLPTSLVTPPMPCLSPPPYEPLRTNALRLIVEANGGPAFLPASDLQVQPAFGPRAALDVRLLERLRLESAIALQIGYVDRVAGPSEPGVTAAIVTEATLLGFVGETVAVGGGFVAGYVFAPDDTRYFLRSSPFVGPVVTPFAWRGGHFAFTVRVPIAFADTTDEERRAVRLAWIAPQVAFGLVFDLVDVDQDDDGSMARR